jgi:nucleotide-binding universal stress UspA family protein
MTAGGEHPSGRAASIFAKALCGIDDTTESLGALQLLLRLTPGDVPVAAIGILDPNIAVHAGWAATAVEADLLHELDANLEAAGALGERVDARLVCGPLLSTLRRLLREERATLLALGSHGMRRAAGITIGSIATTMLHEAPCPVLLARAVAGSEGPSSVVVGVDGSDESRVAAEVARELGDRLRLPVEAVLATGGKPVGPDLLAGIGLEYEVDTARPVKALIERAGTSSLLVVGSRGLHGIRALGSVSERVAHEARCPVLVVRPSNR